MEGFVARKSCKWVEVNHVHTIGQLRRKYPQIPLSDGGKRCVSGHDPQKNNLYGNVACL